jgi:hypothetical protein
MCLIPAAVSGLLGNKAQGAAAGGLLGGIPGAILGAQIAKGKKRATTTPPISGQTTGGTVGPSPSYGG